MAVDRKKRTPYMTVDRKKRSTMAYFKPIFFDE
jgi:hypothetical protein